MRVLWDAGCAEEVTEALPTHPVDGLADTEECHFCKEAGCFDVPVDETVASDGDSEDLGGELDAFVCIDETCESERIAVTEATDANDFEAVDANAVDGVPTSKEAVVEIAAGPSEEGCCVIHGRRRCKGLRVLEGFDGWIVERTLEAEDSIEIEPTVEATVESAEVEDNLEVVEEAVEEAIGDELTDNVAGEEVADAEASAAIATDEVEAIEPLEVEDASGESGEVELAIEESIDEATVVEETAEAIEVAEFEAVESAIEEVTLDDAIENVETDEATDAKVSEELSQTKG